ncbi:MAG: hypothetical protein ACD_2C00146G0001 [uncultured bacterium (gcode 4)]|uniref:DUF1003 domain-containing protein n=1 Tax=uncultured bacterium (gcode 4) TaxID=1234023 RepID=K2G2Y0_9BACT|nr:MAG: hypothetical protein ACD_2C00146G0001 [uncultured bacterium (gcode 4)]
MPKAQLKQAKVPQKNISKTPKSKAGSASKTPPQKIKKDFSIGFTDWVGSKSSLYTHTAFFVGSFVLIFFWADLDKVLLVLTTMVSLEAIYLAIFIQMTVNRNTASLQEVERDIDEIQEDLEEIQEDVDEIQEDLEEIQEDVEEIQEDLEEIQEDVDEIQEDLEEIQEDVEEIQEDVEDISEEDEEEEAESDKALKYIEKMEAQMQLLLKEISELKNHKK